LREQHIKGRLVLEVHLKDGALEVLDAISLPIQVTFFNKLI